MKKGKYVTNQTEVDKQYYKAGNYRFGFTTFANVGCEVAATYNAMISLKRKEWLSQTIYCFEAWAIEFASGWGYLGSNPLEIDRYLKRKGVAYVKCHSLTLLKAAAKARGKCSIIMSRWNKDPIHNGLHTFFLQRTGKKGENAYKSFNWSYKKVSVPGKSLSVFNNNGAGFIVGYIVW